MTRVEGLKKRKATLIKMAEELGVALDFNPPFVIVDGKQCRGFKAAYHQLYRIKNKKTEKINK